MFSGELNKATVCNNDTKDRDDYRQGVCSDTNGFACVQEITSKRTLSIIIVDNVYDGTDRCILSHQVKTGQMASLPLVPHAAAAAADDDDDDDDDDDADDDADDDDNDEGVMGVFGLVVSIF
eukprot:4298878-Amphidinium_carterae.2